MGRSAVTADRSQPTLRVPTMPTGQWQHYHQAAENFAPAFFGRLQPPRQFLDNEPVSLVFHFHPDTFPVVFEVRNIQVARYAAP